MMVSVVGQGLDHDWLIGPRNKTMLPMNVVSYVLAMY